MREWIFVDHEHHELHDALFGPISGHETVVLMEPHWVWEDIWVRVGLFKSKTEARKNMSNRYIGEIRGFHHVIKKKQAIDVAVWREIK